MDTPSRWMFQHSQWALAIETPQEWIKAYMPFNLNGLEQNFKNPMLFLFSEDDIIQNIEIVNELLEFMDSLDCDRSVHLFTKEEGASSHCQMGGLSYAQAVIFHWLDQLVCGKKQKIKPDPVASNAFIKIFKKCGGEMAEKNAQKLLEDVYLI